jgi:hypothetical protein
MIDFDLKLAYLSYIKRNQLEISPTAFTQLTQILDRCQWEEPQTALEWNLSDRRSMRSPFRSLTPNLAHFYIKM